MSAPAAISATFSDFRLVKGRKVAQLVFEIPIEGADDALGTLGGLPQPMAERWFAIARLDLKAAQRAPQPQQAANGKERRQFHELPYAQQAGIKASDDDFQEFLGVDTVEDAAAAIRQRCGVSSRAHIEDDPAAKIKWLNLLRSYDDEFRRGFG